MHFPNDLRRAGRMLPVILGLSLWNALAASHAASGTETPGKTAGVSSHAPDSVTVRKTSKKSPSTGKAAIQPADDPGDDYGKPTHALPDPIQPVNRGIFWFNHQIYHYVFTPLNKAYKAVIPRPVRNGISNAVLNIEYPVRCVNDLLQWKPAKAGLETEKFLLNSTAGIGGLIKVSDKYPKLAEVKPTDTAVTFAKWGIPPGCYIVWPLIGPRSLRDAVGFAGDIALNPASWFTYGIIGGLTGTATLAVSAPQTVGNTSDKLDTYETLTRTSINRYNAVKSAYEQNRKKAESN
jgi:phospholipid-binding lipoprotein MlaA